MCQQSQFITLSESDESQITWCKSCRTFSLSFKCCCASFTESELGQFLGVLRELRARDFRYDFMGKRHAIVKNSCAFIGFCLCESDARTLIKEIEMSITLFEAMKILS